MISPIWPQSQQTWKTAGAPAAPGDGSRLRSARLHELFEAHVRAKPAAELAFQLGAPRRNWAKSP